MYFSLVWSGLVCILWSGLVHMPWSVYFCLVLSGLVHMWSGPYTLVWPIFPSLHTGLSHNVTHANSVSALAIISVHQIESFLIKLCKLAPVGVWIFIVSVMLSHLFTIWGSQVNTKQMNCPRIATIVNHYYNAIYQFFLWGARCIETFFRVGPAHIWLHYTPHAKFCTSGSPLFVSQKIGMDKNN